MTSGGAPHQIRPARLADAAAILDVQVSGWDATYRGLLPDHVFPTAGDPGALRWWRNALCAEGFVTRVAVTSEDVVVGFAAGGGRRAVALGTDGELHALYVRPELLRRGLGRRLFVSFAQALEARRYRSLGLWTLTANARARSFYGALGGEPTVRQVSHERGVAFDETAYVWDPLALALDLAAGRRLRRHHCWISSGTTRAAP